MVICTGNSLISGSLIGMKALEHWEISIFFLQFVSHVRKRDYLFYTVCFNSNTLRVSWLEGTAVISVQLRSGKDALLQPSVMPDFKENFGLYLPVANFNKLYFLLGIDYSTEQFVFFSKTDIIKTLFVKCFMVLGRPQVTFLSLENSSCNWRLDSSLLPALILCH